MTPKFAFLTPEELAEQKAFTLANLPLTQCLTHAWKTTS